MQYLFALVRIVTRIVPHFFQKHHLSDAQAYEAAPGAA
jgi:hypothetical protein